MRFWRRRRRYTVALVGTVDHEVVVCTWLKFTTHAEAQRWIDQHTTSTLTTWRVTPLP